MAKISCLFYTTSSGTFDLKHTHNAKFSQKTFIN